MSPLQQNKPNLYAVFSRWDTEKLLNYAVSLTASILAEREQYKTLSAKFQSTQTSLQGLTLVEEIGRSLSSTLDLNEVLTLLLSRVNKVLQADDSSILLKEEPSGDLVFQISLGSISEQIKPFRVPKGEGIAGEVALTGKPIRVDNAQQDARHFKQIDDDTGFLTKTILCVPLVTREKIVGVIEVFNKKQGVFTDEDQVLLSSIANYAAVAIENARLHQSVLAEKDRVIQAQEEVSRKLQRDLHDGPTQLVAAIQMSADFSRQALEKQPSLVGPELDNIINLAERASHQMRTLLFELRPLILETQGLVAALESFLERRQKDSPAKLHLMTNSDQPGNAIVRLETRSEMSLFAVVQEAVNNALKYAKADNIIVKLAQRQKELCLRIIDDGLGFDIASVNTNYEDRGSYGMVNMKERAELVGGRFSLKSAPGAGTEIRVTIELDDAHLAPPPPTPDNPRP